MITEEDVKEFHEMMLMLFRNLTVCQRAEILSQINQNEVTCGMGVAFYMLFRILAKDEFAITVYRELSLFSSSLFKMILEESFGVLTLDEYLHKIKMLRLCDELRGE